MKDNLETEGIQVLGRERPDLLAIVCRDRFLPPTQLIHALKALEWYPDKQGIAPALLELLDHESASVAMQAAATLGMMDPNGPDNGTAV